MYFWRVKFLLARSKRICNVKCNFNYKTIILENSNYQQIRPLHHFSPRTKGILQGRLYTDKSFKST
jgi:hypothetical protein